MSRSLGIDRNDSILKDFFANYYKKTADYYIFHTWIKLYARLQFEMSSS